MSSFTHFIHVFLFPPFPTPPTTSKRRHSETQSSAPLRSTCPNHLSLPRLTTLSTLSIPKPFLRSLVLLLSFSVTPDIYLTMLFSVLTIAYQPPSSAKFRYHTQAPSVHTLYISFPSLSMKLPSLSTTFSDSYIFPKHISL